MGAGRVSSLSMAFVVAVVLVGTALFQRSEAAIYVVGDGDGWTVPRNDPKAYHKWAKGKNFTVGDILEFKFTEAHDVAQVTKEEFDACTATKPIVWKTTGPANISLTTAGKNYFICTKPGHCQAHQLLKVKVAAAAAASDATKAPSPSPAASPSSAPSSSTLPASAGLFAAVLASVAAFFF